MSGISNISINFRMKVESMYLRLNCTTVGEPDSATPPGSFKATSKTGNGWLWWLDPSADKKGRYITSTDGSQASLDRLLPFISLTRWLNPRRGFNA
jgi:hypothetical protein